MGGSVSEGFADLVEEAAALGAVDAVEDHDPGILGDLVVEFVESPFAEEDAGGVVVVEVFHGVLLCLCLLIFVLVCFYVYCIESLTKRKDAIQGVASLVCLFVFCSSRQSSLRLR